MSLRFDIIEVADLMENFYALTGIRIALYDENYNEITGYPKDCLPFCSHMRKIPEFFNQCRKCEKKHLELAKKTGEIIMYKCHANLTEAIYPIINKGTLMGYIMFGQVSNNITEKDVFRKDLLKLAKKYGHCRNELVKKINFKSDRQLIAASKILKTFTSYILLNEVVKLSQVEEFEKIDKYITEHLHENISVSSLCRKFYISRTQLYELCKQHVPTGIASYIKTKRLNKAKELIQTTDMSVVEISQAVGFSNYNYFLQSFKKHFGVQTKIIRKNR